MEIIIQSLGFKASETLENFIREKVNGLKDDTIIQADVTLYKGPASNPDSDYCEIRLHVPGNDHFVKKHSNYFETAVSECIDILSLKIQKLKAKTGSRRMDKETVLVDSNFEEGTNLDVDLEDVVK